MKTIDQIMSECLTEWDYGSQLSSKRIKGAMEEYAKQQAINFAKWLQESKYFWHYSKIGTLIHYHFDKVANDEYITEHNFTMNF